MDQQLLRGEKTEGGERDSKPYRRYSSAYNEEGRIRSRRFFLQPLPLLCIPIPPRLETRCREERKKKKKGLTQKRNATRYVSNYDNTRAVNCITRLEISGNFEFDVALMKSRRFVSTKNMKF